MYEKYLEIFALSDVFSSFVKHLRDDMHFPGREVATSLMLRFFYAFPQLTFYDWVEILKAYDREYNPDPPKTPVSVPLRECEHMDSILRKRLEKSTAHWRDDTDPIWHNSYYSQNVEKGV